MKTAIVTTTVTAPQSIWLLAKSSPQATLFVAADRKTPKACADLCGEYGNVKFIPVEEQAKWKCSEPIGWNCIQRRNIALLEAVKWGADLIVSWDDDNLPLVRNYAACFQSFPEQFGLAVESPWLNVGALCHPPFRHRGFPVSQDPNSYSVVPVTDARVGVVAGLAFGDPDISAIDRISQAPQTMYASELLRNNVLFQPKPGQWTVYNTQSTAFVRELAPAMFCAPQFQRFDDIIASLICQRVMRDLGYAVRFGQPFVHQQRHPHNLAKDLREEQWGVENIEHIARRLDKVSLRTAESVTRQVRLLYQELDDWQEVPASTCAVVDAFLDDMEGALDATGN